MSDLTIKELYDVMDLVRPPLYYATDENLERGFLFICKETELNPEYIICHPDDLETIKDKIPLRRFVHIRDEPREVSLNRFAEYLRRVS